MEITNAVRGIHSDKHEPPSNPSASTITPKPGTPTTRSVLEVSRYQILPNPFLSPCRLEENGQAADGGLTKAVEIATTRSAHVDAYEAAFASMVRRELDKYAGNLRLFPRNPQELALRVARAALGPKPLTDKRFAVEAFWNWRDLVPDGREHWERFVECVAQSCIRDAEEAHRVATEAKLHRQIVQCCVWVMQAKLEAFKSKVRVYLAGTSKSSRAEDQFQADARDQLQETRDYLRTTATEFLSVMRKDEDRQWLETTLTRPAEIIIGEWTALRRSITHYEPVSMEELHDIVGAFAEEFTHRGHWYSCRNGHPYVIGECGGAMQASSCPQCGEAIGGGRHALNPTNRPVQNMENIARAFGGQYPYWPWNQGV